MHFTKFLKVLIPAVSFFLLSSICLLCTHSHAKADTWYVDGTDGKDPTVCPTVANSWLTAFKSIQKGIDCASEGDEIWVKYGNYLLSFLITVDKNVGIYGGFAGTETVREERDWQTNVTTVDGDNSANHCFYVTRGAIIDGFAITRSSGAVGTSGGGIYNLGCSPTIANCNLHKCSADYGGGIANYTASPYIFNCTFSGNSAESGGGISNRNASNATISNCTFYRNLAYNGGGIYCDSSSPAIKNCRFSKNSATSKGGGTYNYNLSSPTIADCAFYGNISGYGGGIANYNSSSAIISNCTFSGNMAGSGGAICNNSYLGDPSPTITNCIFSINNADFGGGAICNEGQSPAITNCTFYRNVADMGGGIHNFESKATITNCILWDDTPDEIHNESSAPMVTYSDIKGYYGPPGDHNIDMPPGFVKPGTGDFHLGSGSPCIDTGTNDATELPDTDFEGAPRIVDGNRDGTATADMGADEYGDICEGDFGMDFEVDGSDLAIFAANFGRTDCNDDCDGDFDGDGDVDGSDLAVFATDFGRTDCPVYE